MGKRGQGVQKHTKGDSIRPDEALFRRKGAPGRFLEHDIYFSHQRDLPRDGRGVLPDSDLLKAVHAYSSRFYGAQRKIQGDYGDTDERSMDETALLAFGILLEEAGREALGRRGDLVFTEAGALDGQEAAGSSSPREVTVGQQEIGSQKIPRKKRRRASPKTVDSRPEEERS